VQGLRKCAGAYASCDQERTDQKALNLKLTAANGELTDRLAQADEKIAQQATGIPSFAWAVGGGALTVVLLALTGMLNSRK
jgi:hypothetical protein